MSNVDNLKKGIPYRFSSTNQPKNRGRKKKVKNALKDMPGTTRRDFSDLMTTLFRMSRKELEILSRREDLDLATLYLIRAALKGAKNCDTRALRDLMEVAYGKDAQNISLSTEEDTFFSLLIKTGQQRDKE